MPCGHFWPYMWATGFAVSHRVLYQGLVTQGMCTGNEDPGDRVAVLYPYQNHNCDDTNKSMGTIAYFCLSYQITVTPLQRFISLILSQCTLAGPVYTGLPLECHWLTQCTLGYHWKNLVESAPHWDATGETLTFAAYTGTPLEGLWQPTHAPTHIVKHAE